MSYLENIKRTLVENARASTKQETWPVHRRSASALRHQKLHLYFLAAGGNTFNIDSSPSTMGINLGWAGKKTKARMMKADRVERSRKELKVSRRTMPIGMFRMLAAVNFIRQHAVPTLPPEGLCIDLAHTVLILRNHNVGSLNFIFANGMSIKVPYVLDKTKTEAEIYSAWAGLTRLDSKGEQVPIIRPPRLRALPNRSTGEAEAVRTGDV